MGVFEEVEFVLDVAGRPDVLELHGLIEAAGGIISHAISEATRFVIAEKLASFSCHIAVRKGIPVIRPEFVDACIQSRCLLDHRRFAVSVTQPLGSDGAGFTLLRKLLTVQEVELFSSILREDSTSVPEEVGRFVGVAYGYPDPRAPPFPEDSYVIVRRDVFRCTLADGISSFVVLELHAAPPPAVSEGSGAGRSPVQLFRTFLHAGSVEQVEDGLEEGTFETYYYCSANAVLRGYAVLADSEVFRSALPFEKAKLFSGRIGSPRTRDAAVGSVLQHEIILLLERLYNDAQQRLRHELKVDPQDLSEISQTKAERAEALLYEMWQLFTKPPPGVNKTEAIRLLRAEFLKLLPLRRPVDYLFTQHSHFELAEDLVALIRDVAVVLEAVGSQMTAQMRMRALGTAVGYVDAKSEEFGNVVAFVESSRSRGLPIRVKNVFRLRKAAERERYGPVRQKLGNVQWLFHGTPAYNLVSIMSRGLSLPRVLVSQFRGRRPLGGLLGRGIYFSPSASKSAVYNDADSATDGCRYLLVCAVALGRVWKTNAPHPELRKPPPGFDSVQGTRATEVEESVFAEDEFVVYSTDQQSLMYLVEFDEEEEESTDALADVRRLIQQIGQDVPVLPAPQNADVGDAGDGGGIVPAEFAEVPDFGEVGLIATGGSVKLNCFHARALLVDTVGRVVVMQEYVNEAGRALEAKYVFPLDEFSAVCGFEAFIGPKHIVGIVQEKAKAHQAYREAIERGDGAYLMDEEKDKPNVFTVTVGNVPPTLRVLIKITYVTELAVEGSAVRFHLPGTMSARRREGAGEKVTQTVTDSTRVGQDADAIAFSMMVGISMPRKIGQLHSPTHEIIVKREGCAAAVQLESDDAIFTGDFTLLVTFLKMHEPRLWIEEAPNGHVAGMVTFFPSFVPPPSAQAELLLVLDLSSSMAGSSLSSLKRVVLTALQLLPSMVVFNIVTFGSDFQFLFIQPARSSDPVAVRQARDAVRAARADMGGTDLVRVLRALYMLGDRSRAAGAEHNILLVSDGDVPTKDVADVLALAQQNAGHSRLFVLGVGENQNQHFLLSLARAGSGAAEFVQQNKNERGKLERQLARIGQPGATAIRVGWRDADGSPVAGQLRQAPAQVSSLFAGERQIIYAFDLPALPPHEGVLAPANDGRPAGCLSVTLEAFVGDVRVSEDIAATSETVLRGTTLLHILGARALVRDWEAGTFDADPMMDRVRKNQMKDIVVKLGVEWSLVTQFTSFVAIEKREDGELIADRNNLERVLAQENTDVTECNVWSLIDETNMEGQGLDSELMRKAVLETIQPLKLTHYEYDDFGGDTLESDIRTAVVNESRLVPCLVSRSFRQEFEEEYGRCEEFDGFSDDEFEQVMTQMMKPAGMAKDDWDDSDSVSDESSEEESGQYEYKPRAGKKGRKKGMGAAPPPPPPPAARAVTSFGGVARETTTLEVEELEEEDMVGDMDEFGICASNISTGRSAASRDTAGPRGRARGRGRGRGGGEGGGGGSGRGVLLAQVRKTGAVRAKMDESLRSDKKKKAKPKKVPMKMMKEERSRAAAPPVGRDHFLGMADDECEPDDEIFNMKVEMMADKLEDAMDYSPPLEVDASAEDYDRLRPEPDLSRVSWLRAPGGPRRARKEIETELFACERERGYESSECFALGSKSKKGGGGGGGAFLPVIILCCPLLVCVVGFKKIVECLRDPLDDFRWWLDDHKVLSAIVSVLCCGNYLCSRVARGAILFLVCFAAFVVTILIVGACYWAAMVAVSLTT